MFESLYSAWLPGEGAVPFWPIQTQAITWHVVRGHAVCIILFWVLFFFVFVFDLQDDLKLDAKGCASIKKDKCSTMKFT